MIEINIPTLKLVAKNLAFFLNNSNDNPIEFFTTDLLNLVATCHNYENLEAVPKNKIDILNAISKNLRNTLLKMGYNQDIGLKPNTSHDIVAKMYGYTNYHEFRSKQEETPISKLLYQFDYVNHSLYRKANVGYKEDNDNWLTLAAIYIRIAKPNTEIIDIINNTQGIKFLNEVETNIFFNSYNKEQHIWSSELNKEKDTIIKFTKYRFSPDLLINIKKRYEKSVNEFGHNFYNDNDIENSLIEIIDNELWSLLPHDYNAYQLIDPQAYIINNRYYNVVDLHEMYVDEYM